MKVAIGARLREGPWGGGNRFAVALARALDASGHRVAFDLAAADHDILLLTDPRTRNPSVAFAAGAILRYLLFRNPRAIVVHRINECDERKGTTGMNERLWRANYAADHTVFVGRWMVELPVWRAHLRPPWSVIRNGADAGIFHPRGFRPWNGRERLRLVTHHWGASRLKGFDVYERLDAMLAAPEWRERIDFTYVGNLPPGFMFRNARHVAPLDGAALADELRSHHAYVTASINEPGGNHQNEGALCGLPLLYRTIGCMPEYCTGFGVPFDPPDLVAGLERLMAEYDVLAARMPNYPHTATRMCRDYIALFDELLARRDEIVERRRLWRSPWLLLRNQLPV